MDDAIRHPLAYARELRGWPQSELVARCQKAAAARPEGLRTGIDKPSISRYENCVRVPGTDTQLLLADVFGVPHEDVHLHPWPYWLPGRDDPVPLGQPHTVPALRAAQRAGMNHERRTFLTFGALALAGLATQWAELEPERLTTALGGQPVDDGLVDWLESTSSHLMSLPTEQRRHTAKLMDAHLETVTDLLGHGRYSSATGQRLHRLAARLANACGWYRFDQGRHFAAGKLWNAALVNAHAARDRDLGTAVLADFAYQSIWLDQPGSAVVPLGQALTHADHPSARSLLLLRRARAHAALGEAAKCRRDLKAAEMALETTAPEPAPAWCGWMSAADLAVDSGQCLLDLGETRQARALIAEGLELLPRARDKTRGVFRTYEARSLLQAGEVEQAVLVGGESLDLAQRIGADRCVAQVRDLAPDLKRHRQVAGVGDFLERLRVAA
ncbi:helix-turn-helix transcriptional regulator [Streptomyces sp. NPDC089799]|uniref:helix-turn-helix transcriptional regulator n=1 Tax=Streptomyces sp. NPDC089799 TaxID=3155066 RepID=UPI003429EBD5